MSSIGEIFRDLHGTLDFKNVVNLSKIDAKESSKLAEILKVDEKLIFFNKKGIIHSTFFYNGLFYAELMPANTIQQIQFNSSNNHITESIQNGIKYFNELANKKEFETLFNCVDKKVLIKTYNDLYKLIPDDQKWEAFVNLYIRCETAFDTIPQVLLDDLINNMAPLSKKRDKRLFELKKKTHTVLPLNADDKFKVYHGVNGTYNPNDEMSWTLSYQTAKFFANRFGAEGKVVDKKITVDEVIDYFNQRSEQEVLLKVKK